MTYFEKYKQTLSVYQKFSDDLWLENEMYSVIKKLRRLNIEYGLCSYWLHTFNECFPIKIEGYIHEPTPEGCEDVDELTESLQARIDFLIENKIVFMNLDDDKSVCDLPVVLDPNQLTLPF